MSGNERGVNESQIAQQRLNNQGISSDRPHDPVEVVRWLGAVQSQDFAGAKWAVGLRARDSTETDVEAAFNAGRILRTHVLRPTWHFVAPEDIRWLLDLSAPRVNAAAGYNYRRLGLDDDVFHRSQRIFERQLRDSGTLTREQMIDVLKLGGIATDNLSYVHLLMRAELDGLICSGPRLGNKFTYALLDERAPHARRLQHDEALTELTLRYFASHGPASVRDFAWWSGLTMRDARAGISAAGTQLERLSLDGTDYWRSPEAPMAESEFDTVHLLPNFDEYIVGYRDRGAYWHESQRHAQVSRANPLFTNTIISHGQIIGTWSRATKKNVIDVTLNPFVPLDEAQSNSLDESVKRYGRFLNLPVNLL